jgi:hypothetical protein
LKRSEEDLPEPQSDGQSEPLAVQDVRGVAGPEWSSTVPEWWFNPRAGGVAVEAKAPRSSSPWRGPISRGDLIRTVELLGIRPSDSRRFSSLLETLGFVLRESDDAKRHQEEPTDLEKEAPEVIEIPETPWDPTQSSEGVVREHWATPPREGERRKLRPRQVRRPEPPPELLRVPLLPEEPVPAARVGLPLEPLFNPRWSRHIVSGALSVRRPEGPLDVEAICRHVGRGEAFRQVPRRLWPTLRRRLHVLVDYGEGMEPYHRDQSQLLEALRKVVGLPRMKVFGFVGHPSRGVGNGLVLDWQPYHWPESGTAVLLLSDLGLAPIRVREGKVTVSEWVAFVRHLSLAGSPVLCITPHDPKRFPQRLRRWVTVIRWDRSTSPGKIRRLLSKD